MACHLQRTLWRLRRRRGNCPLKMLFWRLSSFSYVRSFAKSAGTAILREKRICGVDDFNQTAIMDFRRWSSSSVEHDESNMDFETEKERFLKMPLHDKRRIYSCKRFVVLSDIETQLGRLHHSNIAGDSKGQDSSTLQGSANRVAGVSTDGSGDCPASKVSLWQGDITALEVDAIVNAANSRLAGGGGVDGAIHRAAGKNLSAECRTFGGCRPGGAKISGGYRLPAKYVIHTVGPMGENAVILRSCYEESLRLMQENNLRSVAFPCISTGVYGYPPDKAANVALKATAEWLAIKKNNQSVDRIIFCVFLEEDRQIYEQLLPQYFPAKGLED